MQANPTRTSTQADPSRRSHGKASSQPNREIFTCPFSNESTFVTETAEHLEPSPMDQFEHWRDNLGIRWLAAGLSGQDQPGYLRAQLKRFRHHQHFLLKDHLLGGELALKEKALNDPLRHPQLFVMEPESLDAQQETLELFMAYLPERYPDTYVYDKQENKITVVLSNQHRQKKTYFLDDWKDSPLELCARIVQEDLVLMRETPNSFNMAAAAVVFSFNDLPQRLGTTANFIHAPVPGYGKHLSKVLHLSFKNIKAEKPLWRNNWTFVPSGRLDEPSDSFTHEHELQAMEQTKDVRDRYLKVEYQTIRRLPRSGYLLFTIRTFTDPLAALESDQVPAKAAATLAASIRGMTSPKTLEYRGIESDESRQAVLQYLDSITESRVSR